MPVVTTSSFGQKAEAFFLGATNFQDDAAHLELDFNAAPNPDGDLGQTTPTRQYTFSCWFEINRAETGLRRLLDGGSNGYFRISLNGTGNEFQVWGRNPSGSAVRLDIDSSTTYGVDPGVWHHLLFSVDMDVASSARLYIDDVNVTVNNVQTADDLASVHNRWAVGGRVNNTTLGWPGCLSEVWFDMDRYVDLDVVGNRRGWITAGGAPADLGADGSNPVGAQPQLYMKCDFATRLENRGSGEDFNQALGTQAACGSVPT